METENIKKIGVIGKRPDDVPEAWPIFNAPRPLYGHKEWQGLFEHGIFYAAVDPDEYGAEGFVKRNVSLDGWLVEYWTKEGVLTETKRYLLEKYSTDEEAIDALNERALIDTFYNRNHDKDR